MLRLLFFYKSFYLSSKTYLLGGIIVGVFVLSFFFPFLIQIPKLLLLLLCLLVFADTVILYFKRRAILAQRIMAQRFSNGDENKVTLVFEVNYPFNIKTKIVDEIPDQFQQRNWQRNETLQGNKTVVISYVLQPTERGEYKFGNILLFAKSPLGLIIRKFNFSAAVMVCVYPSYIQLRRYEILSVTHQLNELGSKQLRKIGHSLEFEQIKEYVRGDDVRTINWKATARKNQLMVNNYTDEKSQQIYCLIDKGRLMKMPFEGMTLLDYAINTALVLSNVALIKQDKAGLVTFDNKMGSFVPATKSAGQMEAILETLYNQKTNFLESDYELLYMHLRNKIKQRSLIVLFTNFESLSGLQRQLPYLRHIARHHLLLTVFFENTELKHLRTKNAENTEEIYIKTIAEKFAHEKRQIVKELQMHGILSILTPPANLTIETINKYLEIKARQQI